MANTQGMCKNCGSLIMFDNRDDMCECVFCNCVFPSEEAVSLLANPEGHEFKNEKFEQSSNSHHFTTRTYSTESLEKSIMREEVAKSNSEESSSHKNEFEVTAKDVKAPKKVIRNMWLSALAFVVVVVGIALPLYLSRKNTYKKVDAGINTIVRNIIDDESVPYDYSITGTSCKTFKLIADATINSAEAEQLFADYCKLLSDDGSTSGVKVTVYYDNGIWEVVDGKATEVIEVVEETAETAETAETEENA